MINTVVTGAISVIVALGLVGVCRDDDAAGDFATVERAIGQSK